MNYDVIIIGAGISGLTAANYLEDAGFSPLIIEATSRVGGRVKTDVKDGYRMDRGFQVFLPSYPEAKRLLDYDALDLKYFKPGAKILTEAATIETVADPLRDWSQLLNSVFAPVGTLKDKLKILSLKKSVEKKTVKEIFAQKDTKTIDFLRNFGFSDEMINAFFQPFFAGIFLEKSLKTSSNMFEFVFKMFAEKSAALPARGIGEIAVQLKSKLEQSTFVFNERVTHIEGNKVFTNNHQQFSAPFVVLATEAIGLIRQYKEHLNTKYQGTSCLYFACDEQLPLGKYVTINATNNRIINNLAVLSNVSEDYAPKGKNLIVCSVVGLANEGNEELLQATKAELKKWLGENVEKWQHLKTYHIPFALSNQEKVEYDKEPSQTKLKEGLFYCGDHMLNSSLNAAMRSGRMAAEAIIQEKK
jgi:protoporphyrinogen oxidase